MATCHIHQDRETGRSCTRCGRPACPQCLVDAAVGSHCVTCVKAAQPSTKERVRRTWKGDTLLVSKALIAVNVMVYLLSFRSKATGTGLNGIQQQADHWGLYGPYVKSGDWYRLITAGFIHGGLLHLAFNSLAIYRLGQALESSVGRLRYLGIFLVAVLAGSAGAVLLSPHALTVGASGGAFGLMGAGAWAMRMRGYKFNQTGFGQVIVMNLLITLAIPQISLGGHVGGLIGGGIAAAAVLGPHRPPNAKRDIAIFAGLMAAMLALGLVIAQAQG